MLRLQGGRSGTLENEAPDMIDPNLTVLRPLRHLPASALCGQPTSGRPHVHASTSRALQSFIFSFISFMLPLPRSIDPLTFPFARSMAAFASLPLASST